MFGPVKTCTTVLFLALAMLCPAFLMAAQAMAREQQHSGATGPKEEPLEADGQWSFHVESNFLYWGFNVAIRGLIQIPIHLVPAYMILKGNQRHSTPLAWLGTGSKLVLLGATGWFYFQTLAGMIKDTLSAASYWFSSQSQPWPTPNFYNTSDPLDYPTFSYSPAPLVHYHQDQAGNNHLWINQKVPEFVLECLIIPWLSHKIKQYYLQEATPAPANPTLVIEASEQVLEDLPPTPAPQTGYQGPIPKIIITKAPKIEPPTIENIVTPSMVVVITEAPVTVVSPPPMIADHTTPMRYPIAEDFFTKQEIKRLKFRFLSDVFQWLDKYTLRENQNRVIKSPWSITGGQALLMHHKHMLGLSWEDYWQHQDAIETNDLDIFVFRPNLWSAIFNDLFQIEFSFSISDSPVHSRAKFTQSPLNLEHVNSHFWGFSKGRRFISLYGVDLVKKSAASIETAMIDALENTQGQLSPVMNLEYELERLEDVLPDKKGTPEFTKYLSRLWLLIKAQVQAIYEPGNRALQPEPKLTQLAQDYQDPLGSLPQGNQAIKKTIRRLLNHLPKTTIPTPSIETPPPYKATTPSMPTESPAQVPVVSIPVSHNQAIPSSSPPNNGHNPQRSDTPLANGPTTQIKKAVTPNKQLAVKNRRTKGAWHSKKTTYPGEVNTEPESACSACCIVDTCILTSIVSVFVARFYLGGDIQVPTPRGRITVRIPRGSSTGRRLRLKGKGVVRGSDEGHMYVTLRVMLPVDRDPELEKLIKSWANKGGQSMRKKAGLA